LIENTTAPTFLTLHLLHWDGQPLCKLRAQLSMDQFSFLQTHRDWVYQWRVCHDVDEFWTEAGNEQWF
jgi:hypothetical protein